MGQFIKYKCDVCGHEHVQDLEVFWIDENCEINVSMLLFLTSTEMSKALVSGYYHEYYCYDCDSIVKEFIISENPSKMSSEDIINLIEDYDHTFKIIKFDDKFQNCLNCSRSLDVRSEKAFAVGKDDDFVIEDSYIHDFKDNDNYDFWGYYYGYYCDNCKKQINKFVVMQNLSNVDEDSIRYILKQHTNELTVLLFDYRGNCQHCGGELHSLKDSSLCPKCKEGHFITVEVRNVD